MNGNLLLVILVNQRNQKIIIDYKTTKENCSPEIGTNFEDWDAVKTSITGLQDEYGNLGFKEAFKETGIYKIDGWDIEGSEPENGWYSEYEVIEIVKLADLSYDIEGQLMVKDVF